MNLVRRLVKHPMTSPTGSVETYYDLPLAADIRPLAAGDGAFSGALNVGSQLTLQMSETIRCSGQPDEKRQLSLSMLKQ
jgi:hypothetical protein